MAAAARGIVRRWGDLQFPTDRLDPEAVPVSVDEAAHLGSRGSSSRANKAETTFRISFARRSSQFSRARVSSR